jgi:hypothetical protein
MVQSNVTHTFRTIQAVVQKARVCRAAAPPTHQEADRLIVARLVEKVETPVVRLVVGRPPELGEQFRELDVRHLARALRIGQVERRLHDAPLLLVFLRRTLGGAAGS